MRLGNRSLVPIPIYHLDNFDLAAVFRDSIRHYLGKLKRKLLRSEPTSNAETASYDDEADHGEENVTTDGTTTAVGVVGESVCELATISSRSLLNLNITMSDTLNPSPDVNERIDEDIRY